MSFYNLREIRKKAENDEIDDGEEGFMIGYLNNF